MIFSITLIQFTPYLTGIYLIIYLTLLKIGFAVKKNNKKGYFYPFYIYTSKLLSSSIASSNVSTPIISIS